METARSTTRVQLRKDEAERLAEEDAGRATATREASDVVAETDDLLDEIDALLEDQSVLVNFRQKGGQ